MHADDKQKKKDREKDSADTDSSPSNYMRSRSDLPHGTFFREVTEPLSDEEHGSGRGRWSRALNDPSFTSSESYDSGDAKRTSYRW